MSRTAQVARSLRRPVPTTQALREIPAREELSNASTCQVIHNRGAAEMPFNRGTVEGLLESGGFFWLDLSHPTQKDFSILRNVFKFHPLAVEDSEQFNQRAKVDVYDDFV